MLNFAWLIAAKDLKILFSCAGTLLQALLLGLLILFIFSLSKGTGALASPQEAATVFWLSSLFCQILIFNQLYALEEHNEARQGLILSPYPPQGIWLGKACAGLALLFISQLIFFPAAIIFMGQDLSVDITSGLAILALTDIGICALGSLIGAINQGQNGRESLLSILLFPLLIPIILGGISVGAKVFGGECESMQSWLSISCAFDAIFLGAGLSLFGFLFQGED